MSLPDGRRWVVIHFMEQRRSAPKSLTTFFPGAAMVNDDLVKCPLCGGFTHVDQPALLAALNDPKIRQQIGNYMAELLRHPSSQLAGVASGQPHSQDHTRDVHNWNPNMPIWRRSPKE
ncbi:MAG TPA: hypothetical protein VMU61_03080 [Candidatus Aquilonibacter sp.]|nr:hypothetical protein [Candidatus Aquilonibacter sp.]